MLLVYEGIKTIDKREKQKQKIADGMRTLIVKNLSALVRM